MRTGRCWFVFLSLVFLICGNVIAQEILPGTVRLDWQGDLADKMIAGIDRFLLSKLDTARTNRDAIYADPEEFQQSTDEQRRRLSHILGVRDEQPTATSLELVATITSPAEVGRGDRFRILRVRWKAVGGIHGEGLVLEPDGAISANVLAIPDAEQTPEWLAGSGYARLLANSGCRVVIPAIVSRRVQKRRNAELTDREYIYRSAFELGRHVTGYELQKIFAVVDWFNNTSDSTPVGVLGWGEGGRLALYAAALDTSIDFACVSGYFGPREGIWQEPIDRNVFGLLNHFGDAEIAALIAPRKLFIDNVPGPRAEVKTRGGAPYQLRPQPAELVAREVARARKLLPGDWVAEIAGGVDGEDSVSMTALKKVAGHVGLELPDSDVPLIDLEVDSTQQDRLIAEMDAHNQRLLEQSPYTRKEFFQKLDVTSLAGHKNTVEWYRDYFREQVVGAFDDELLPANPRTRKVFDQPKWTGYEVVLDVFPDVFAFGILLLPKDLRPDERRPVVVCQHGLEGRPRNVIEKDHGAYHDYAAKLAERGFITFAPQNIYIFTDRFRTLQRKANPIGKTLFSIMVPQHQQIVDWLAGLPHVDPQRIAFYGLSYGGKSAMRIPPLVDRYCLSICSADFNDWVWKNASTLSPYSYVWTGEYEIFEWDLGSTFNYAEMAALIAPRPFMVERGHFDGVAPDERVAYEFAKVRHLYQAKLGIGDRCEIEFFVGPHTIHGQGTFDFLHRHLDWPKPPPE